MQCVCAYACQVYNLCICTMHVRCVPYVCLGVQVLAHKGSMHTYMMFMYVYMLYIRMCVCVCNAQGQPREYDEIRVCIYDTTVRVTDILRPHIRRGIHTHT
jgi:hypothetical protein